MATMVAAADFALHHELTTLDELSEVLAVVPRAGPGVEARRTCPRAGRRAGGVATRVDQPARIRLAAPAARRSPSAGSTTARRFVGRCDFYWDEFGVVGEADGEAKLQDRDDLVAEKQTPGRAGTAAPRRGAMELERRRPHTSPAGDARIRDSFNDGRAPRRHGLSPPVVGSRPAEPSDQRGNVRGVSPRRRSVSGTHEPRHQRGKAADGRGLDGRDTVTA